MHKKTRAREVMLGCGLVFDWLKRRHYCDWSEYMPRGFEGTAT